MNPNIMILALIVVDFALLGVVFYLFKRVNLPPASIFDLTGEREMLNQMRQSIIGEMQISVSKCETVQKKVSLLAMEIEQEVKQGHDRLAKDLKSLSESMMTNFNSPLEELAQKASHLEAIIAKSEKQRNVLGKVLTRAENICDFFNDKVPYQEILKDIEEKKYSDARRLMGMGVPAEKIANDLNLSLGQVRMIQNI